MQRSAVQTPLPYHRSEVFTIEGPKGTLQVTTLPNGNVSVKRIDDGVVVIELHPDEAETMIETLRDVINK